MEQKQTVLFCPFNESGHVNCLLGIADRLKNNYNLRTIFLLTGPPCNGDIKNCGHEIISIRDGAILEDYEIDERDDLMGPITNEELQRNQSREKKNFSGPSKWPQIISRCQKAFSLEPVEAYIKAVDLFSYGVEDMVGNNEKYGEMIAKIEPDLIVVDLYYIHPSIVKFKTTPWVNVFSPNPLTLMRSKLPNGVKPPHWTGFKLWTKDKRERMRQEEPEKWQAILDEWQEAFERINRALEKSTTKMEEIHARHNLDKPEPQRPNLISPYLNLYMYPKALDYDKEDDILEYEKHWLRYDSLIRNPFNSLDTKFTKIWLDMMNNAMVGKESLVYFSLGSQASEHTDLMNNLLEMLHSDELRCYLVSKGSNGHKIRLNPSNMIGENFVPQTFILQHCNLAIIHGGNNSITECLYYGVPIIVLPVFFDQFDNAQRIEDLGLGKKLMPYSCSSADLMKAINDVLSDESLINKCRAISEEMKARDDSRKIPAMLKKLMDEGKLDKDFIEECRTKDYEEIKF